LGGWQISDAAGKPVAGVTVVQTPEDAVRAALAR